MPGIIIRTIIWETCEGVFFEESATRFHSEVENDSLQLKVF